MSQQFKQTRMNIFTLHRNMFLAVARLYMGRDILATRITQANGKWPDPQIKTELNRIGAEVKCQPPQ